MKLDLATVLVLHPLSLVMGSVCFLYAMSQSRHHRGLGKMAIAFLLLGGGSVLAALGENQALPYAFWTFTSFALGPIAYCLFWVGLRNLVHEQPMQRSLWVFLIPASLIVAALVTGFHLSNSPRATIFLLTMAAFAIAGAWLVFSDPLQERLVSRHALSGVLCAKALTACAILVSIDFPDIAAISPAAAFCVLVLCQYGIAMFVLIFVQERVESRLVKLTETDTLTGIRNRHWLHDHLPQTIAPGDVYIAVDIDFFKRVNDVHGHSAGDQVLVATAQRMARILGEGALLARMGGEEFGLFERACGAAKALAMAESLRLCVQSLAIRYQETFIPVTISVGVAVAQESMTPALLMRRADEALYDAKHQGRNRVNVWAEKPVAENTDVLQSEHVTRYAAS
ncbi:GGDEF domain-containing protein [Rhizobium oryzicola]|uniref:diguanylate cyclase n=1 Tax=Rhizobium oryzicola TaxID=1232668 RepID=A0ABT8T416_9HYPH|nr:GGDEF domain-containing protein [Rhizobium oryzicola]MDO1585331.1 GGDEF domain-containing protein [Rhizobium oryzicola]